MFMSIPESEIVDFRTTLIVIQISYIKSNADFFSNGNQTKLNNMN